MFRWQFKPSKRKALFFFSYIAQLNWATPSHAAKHLERNNRRIQPLRKNPVIKLTAQHLAQEGPSGASWDAALCVCLVLTPSCCCSACTWWTLKLAGPVKLSFFSTPSLAHFKCLSKFHPKVELASAGQPLLSPLLVFAARVPNTLKSWGGMALPWLSQDSLKSCPSWSPGSPGAL